MSQTGGLFSSVSTLLASVLGIAQTRLALLANEVEEQKIHLLSVFFCGVLLLFFFVMGLILSTLFIIGYFWQAYGLLVLAMVAAGYLGIALVFAIVVTVQIRNRPKAFAISLAELSKDRTTLESAQ